MLRYLLQSNSWQITMYDWFQGADKVVAVKDEKGLDEVVENLKALCQPIKLKEESFQKAKSLVIDMLENGKLDVATKLIVKDNVSGWRNFSNNLNVYEGKKKQSDCELPMFFRTFCKEGGKN